MFILGEFFQSFAYLINGICQILYWLLFARIVISWFPVDPYHSVVQFLYQVTDPILLPLRRLPLQIGMLDLTPLVAFFLLQFANRVLVRLFLMLALRFGAGG